MEGLLVLLFVAEPVFAEGRCVPGISLIPHYPKVMDPNEAAIPLSERVYPGVVTFVNLDNDDDDGTFDDADNEVVGGDNELVKVSLEIPVADNGETVCLDVPKGGEYISVWTNRMKSANAALPLPATFRIPADFSKGENSTGTHDVLRKDIWVEGIAPHTIPTNTQLRLTHEFAPGQVVTNLASITVVGVESVRWKGRGNSVRDDNNLDEDPNWPTGLLPGSVRVFPGARSVDGVVEAGARDTVDVEVTLSVPTPRPVDVFLKSFDVDDPTADETDVVENHCVDREEYSWDNRGREPAKDGRFVGDQSAAHVCALSFPAGTKTASTAFQTTLQPGDNFRIVANADSNFLKKLENTDGIGMSNPDKQRICHKDVSGTFADREIRNPDKYASSVLTVWRFLHLEIDTMENPVRNGPQSNCVTGLVTRIAKSGNFAEKIFLDRDLVNIFTPPDTSVNLDSGVDLGSMIEGQGIGRFENGSIRLGNLLEENACVEVSKLTGNGNDYVMKTSGLRLPMTLRKNEQTIPGNMVIMDGRNIWFTTPISFNYGQYANSILSFAGISANVQCVSPSTEPTHLWLATLSAPMAIPFALHDDDQDQILTMPEASFVKMKTLFVPAYVIPVNDGGGNPSNNGMTPFRRNLPSSEGANYMPQFIGSLPNRKKHFWTGYCLFAFQFAQTPEAVGRENQHNPKRADSDPDSEANLRGVNVTDVGSVFFSEAVRERRKNDVTSWSRLFAHEVAHQLGVVDNYYDGIPRPHDIMGSGVDNENSVFQPAALDAMRSSTGPEHPASASRLFSTSPWFFR